MSSVKSVKSLHEAIGYTELSTNILEYQQGDIITIPEVIGHLKWRELDRSEKVTLGKLISSNITSGNLTGITPVETPNGKPQRYRITGEFKLNNVFWVKYWGHLESEDDVKSFIQNMNTAYIVSSYKSLRNTDSITLKCNVYVGNRKVITETRDKKLGNIGMTDIPQGNQEFASIQSIWYGYDRVFENLKLLKHEGVNNLVFIAPNPQMVLRIAGENCNDFNNSYAYTDYIQRNFDQFIVGGLREIDLPQVIVSTPKKVIDKIFG